MEVCKNWGIAVAVAVGSVPFVFVTTWIAVHVALWGY